ncbi:GNAT family N-acetyltransferase [Photobacterium sp. 1_MG-2023]|uniref:GNAT family N-acetyltransferase n=1 Tax=Photobacterium sp. 1_MG-2023 TaxID=3062646 RepID=UPI0026E3231F|nr:GNAT family N-acetyltransferase [Photobacterium sp. 1_MG-2023]MDO6706003.1 GNAT family N-acetyltransferase [Photobacterium sp. 1_MG-2023]
MKINLQPHENVIITPVSSSHVISFHQCLDTVAKEKQYLAQTAALPLETFTQFVKENVANDAIQWIALAGQQVVGWADIFSHWAPTLRHRGQLGMGVHPDFRGQGIGELLLKSCLTKAKSKGVSRVELETRADNQASLNLYQKLGFNIETVIPNGMNFDGKYFDTVQMSLVFD